jgi:dienelactone hydrolase
MPLDERTLKAYLEFYDYDMEFPFETETSEREARGGCVFHDVKLESVHDQTVPAIYGHPKEGGPFPGLVFLHGRGGSKTDILDLAPVLATGGYAGMAIDCQYHGDRNPRKRNIYSEFAYSDRDAMIQTVVDARRSVDYLQSREEVDSGRIGLIGGSMGGILGTLLAAVEMRIVASVLLVAGGNWEILAAKSQHGDGRALRSKDVDVKHLAEVMAPVDPINFVSLISPRPVLFQLGRKDDIVPAETGRLLVEAAKEPKEVDWYDAGHGLPLDKVVPRVLSWLEANLKEA